MLTQLAVSLAQATSQPYTQPRPENAYGGGWWWVWIIIAFAVLLAIFAFSGASPWRSNRRRDDDRGLGPRDVPPPPRPIV